LRLNFTLARKGATTDIAVSTNGPDDVVRYVMNTFFGDNLLPWPALPMAYPRSFVT